MYRLLEITPALGALQGVVMELNDCAFPTLNRIVASAHRYAEPGVLFFELPSW